tara:strand:+ start:2619 stop:2897 length:279 start_codon:yes stop_codon:yes gene_type:complete
VNQFTEEEEYAINKYLWLDYSIETLWLYYANQYQGHHDITEEEEINIMEMMEYIYDLETDIIQLIDHHNITFAMIDKYKEIHNVSNWPTRFC